jgi:hypothetical protein
VRNPVYLIRIATPTSSIIGFSHFAVSYFILLNSEE